MIPRESSIIIGKLRKQFPVITLTGPRQSGKTTLLKTKNRVSVHRSRSFFVDKMIEISNLELMNDLAKTHDYVESVE